MVSKFVSSLCGRFVLGGGVLMAQPASADPVTGCLFRNYIGAIGQIFYSYKDANNRSYDKTGTGFVIDPAGTMLTAAHVVTKDIPGEAYEETIKVRMGDWMDNQIIEASREDSDTKKDVALLSLPQKLGESWPTVPISKTAPVTPGDSVYAFGFPEGFDATVTPPAIVSSLNTKIKGKRTGMWLQTSLDLTPGMSGGPVFGAGGTVIGLSVRMHQKLSDVSYVLPNKKFRNYLDNASGSDDNPPCAQSPQRSTEEVSWSSRMPNMPLGVHKGQGDCFLTKVRGVFNSNSASASAFVDEESGEFYLGKNPKDVDASASDDGVYSAAARCVVFARP